MGAGAGEIDYDFAMRIFAVSDLHIDYKCNAEWLSNLSATDYRNDLLILAGDVADALPLLEWGLKSLAHKFHQVLFVPGNHDVWINGDTKERESLEKFRSVCAVADNCNVSMKPFHCGPLSIVPLFGWYDYSFGPPQEKLQAMWLDFEACIWPNSFELRDVTFYFIQLNESLLQTRNETVISFSHFLPRIDVMPSFIPREKRILYPVLGTTLLEEQVRRLLPKIHVYGHSHVNQRVVKDGICYVNNAFGYPSETRITAKTLIKIAEVNCESRNNYLR
jgi:predicted phosphodiesterase